MPSTAMTHLKHLTLTIGARGSTTPQERQAAEYARRHFESLGLETHWEEFVSPKTGWRPFSAAAILGLGCLALFLFGSLAGALLAAVVMTLTSVSVVLESLLLPNPLQWLMPKGPSQNVWARIPAAGKATRTVLVLGHMDTQRTPWIFKSARRLAFFRLMTTLSVVSFVLSAIFYLLSIFINLGPFRWLALVFAPIFVIVLALTWEPDTTPHTQGANDNGSGASIVLSLADRLAHAPLKNIEVWALCSGCEEVGAHGIRDFLKRHCAELPNLTAINLDNVGGKGAGVCYILLEGIVVPFKPSAELVQLADAVRAARPDLNAYSKPFTTLGTDATCLMLHKVPSLSFLGLTPDGLLPNWHQVTDTFERVDAGAVEATEEFVLEMLRRLK